VFDLTLDLPAATAVNGTASRSAALNVLVVTSEAPPIVSGVSRSVDRLVAGLRDRGHRVDVLSSLQIPRVTVGEWRMSLLAAWWPVVARRLRVYDVVNLHGPVPTMSDAFFAMCRLLPLGSSPIVYTHHSALEIPGAERLCEVYNRVHRALSARATVTVTTSPYYAESQHAAGAALVRVVPWGVDLRPESLDARRTKSARLWTLFVGQMRSYKGVDWLLRAVAGHPEIELTLIGDGPHRRYYQRLAADLDAENARFLGHVPDDALYTEYDRSDVVVLPSVTRAEAFGLVVLEGMAAGCVPVVSDLPGVRDLVSEVGVVVPPRNAHALRGALLGLLADRARLEQLGKAARQRAAGFRWKTCVDWYEEALIEAVELARADRRAAALPRWWRQRPVMPPARGQGASEWPA